MFPLKRQGVACILLLPLLPFTLAGAPDLRLGVYHGRPVCYEVVDGQAIAENDIVLGASQELTAEGDNSKGFARSATVRPDPSRRWPDLSVVYTIDPAFPNPQRVKDAIAHWQINTPIQFRQRTTEINYVRFVSGSGCSSTVGMAGGAQSITLAAGCGLAAAIHEIGHAVGLWHEQSRQDRSYYLRLSLENVDKMRVYNYDQQLNDGEDSGPYDYGSIMHYGGYDFSRNGIAAMKTAPPGIPIGTASGLSAGDIQAVKRLYGVGVTDYVVAAFPSYLQVLVDGELVTDRKSFDWAVGSVHTIEAADGQMAGGVQHQFGRWSNDGPQIQQITVDGNTHLFQASFVRKFQVASAAIGHGQIVVTPPSDDGYYPEGTVLKIEAVPDDGWNFLKWLAVRSLYNGRSSNPATLVLRNSNASYIAQFTQSSVTRVDAPNPGVTATIDGSTYTLPVNFAWEPGTTHTLAVPNPVQKPADININAYRDHFNGWSIGGDTSQSVKASDQPTTITAQFQRYWQVILSPLVETRAYITNSQVRAAMATIAPDSADGYFPEDSTVQVNLTPAEPYRFQGWYGDLAGQPATANIIVNDQQLFFPDLRSLNTLTADAVVNAASYSPGPVAPGELLVLFGTGFGPSALATLEMDAATGRASTTLGGLRAFFDDVAAPLVYVSDSQVSVAAPYSLGGKEHTVLTLEYQGKRTAPLQLTVAAAVPALFTADSSGIGQAAALNQDGSVNSAQNPAARGSVVVLYATGEGAADITDIDGKRAALPLPRPSAPITVQVANRPAVVTYAGGAPGLIAGLMQVNIVIPADCPEGAIPVRIQSGDSKSFQTVTIAVQ